MICPSHVTETKKRSLWRKFVKLGKKKKLDDSDMQSRTPKASLPPNNRLFSHCSNETVVSSNKPIRIIIENHYLLTDKAVLERTRKFKHIVIIPHTYTGVPDINIRAELISPPSYTIERFETRHSTSLSK